VTKALDVETVTEAVGFETEAKTEEIYLETKAKARGSLPTL